MNKTTASINQLSAKLKPVYLVKHMARLWQSMSVTEQKFGRSFQGLDKHSIYQTPRGMLGAGGCCLCAISPEQSVEWMT